MKKRAYVLIFFFWALLTIITPTLVQWSAAAAAAAAARSEEGKIGKESSASTIEEPINRARKMMEVFQETHYTNSPPQPPPLPPPAPAPEEEERMNKQKYEGLIFKQVFSSRRHLEFYPGDWSAEGSSDVETP